MPTLLETRQLTKNYGRIRAVQDLSVTIERGEPIGLVGPNGAGKTTLFSLVAGFISPDKGQVIYNGSSRQGSDLIGQIGILPQDAPFLKGIKVREQLTLFAQLQGMNKQQAITETHRVATDFNVDDLINRYPENLSYGQRKRVALAQAILGQPELVLLDEPTSGLDPVVADDVRHLITTRANEITFLISSHNLAELEDICKTIIIINEGKLVTSSSVAELRGQDQHLSLELGSELTGQIISDIKKISGVLTASHAEHDLKHLLLEFDCPDPDRVQMEVLNTLQQSGITVINFSRGKKLSDGIVKLVRGEVG